MIYINIYCPPPRPPSPWCCVLPPPITAFVPRTLSPPRPPLSFLPHTLSTGYTILQIRKQPPDKTHAHMHPA